MTLAQKCQSFTYCPNVFPDFFCFAHRVITHQSKMTTVKYMTIWHDQLIT